MYCQTAQNELVAELIENLKTRQKLTLKGIPPLQ
jgi:hypothetical protein